MALLGNRILETSTSSGLSDFVLAGAVTGYFTAASELTNGDRVFYTAEAVTTSTGAPTGAVEIGLGTWDSATNTIQRTTVTRSTSGVGIKHSFAAGTKRVFCAATKQFLEVMSTLGDLLYQGATLPTRLAGNTTTTKKFLQQTGTGVISAAPTWDTLAEIDIPSLTAYALLAGRAGGQTLNGGTASGEDLTLTSTANATKGDVFINGATTWFDASGFLTMDLTGTANNYSIASSASEPLVQHKLGATMAYGIRSDAKFQFGSLGWRGDGAIFNFNETDGFFRGSGAILFKLFFQDDSTQLLLQSGHSAFLANRAAFYFNTAQTISTSDLLNLANNTTSQFVIAADGRVKITTPASAPTDAWLKNGSASFYIDETTHNIHVRVKYSDGTLKTGTVALV